MVLIQAYQKMCLLSELLPLYIILYDPDTQFVREIEVHQVGPTTYTYTNVHIYNTTHTNTPSAPNQTRVCKAVRGGGALCRSGGRHVTVDPCMSCGGWRGQATRPRDEKRIRVYFMVYEDSVEEQRYLTTLK
jgi:hypothetical protein